MTWKRLEGSGVANDLTAGLEARIADPLWMLARQWQTGEFAGEDAASPVEIAADVDWQPLGEMRIGTQPPRAIATASGVPLEAQVESESVRRGPSRMRLAAESALQLLRLAREAGADTGLLARLQQAHPLRVPKEDGGDARGALELRLLARGAFDGLALADALTAGAKPDPAIAKIAAGWLAALRAQLVEPPGAEPAAWDRERLEYGFEIAAPAFAGGTRLEAKDYPGGHLDWQSFDMAAKQKPLLAAAGKRTQRIATVPVPLSYPGMPAPRWWSFEDGAVYWGDIQGGPADLARYLVASFATVYGDDWFLVPVELPRGSLAQVAKLVLRDSFGRRHRIDATAVGDHARVGAARSFRVFELTGDSAVAAGSPPRLLMPASLPVHEEGEPREEVLLLRDEAANLGWAVERVIESAAGRRIQRGAEANAVPARPSPAPAPGAWHYDLASAVPPHFVPLVPVRVAGGAAIRLQRGRLAIAGGMSGARGVLLDPAHRLLLREEEVPTSGVRVTRGYQLARGADGSVHVWCGRRKSPGARLQGPGLAHDAVRIVGDADRDGS